MSQLQKDSPAWRGSVTRMGFVAVRMGLQIASDHHNVRDPDSHGKSSVVFLFHTTKSNVKTLDHQRQLENYQLLSSFTGKASFCVGAQDEWHGFLLRFTMCQLHEYRPNT